ncbi:MAG: hypothetical protein QOI03_1414 [Solirubrobacteraceae bacterium]|jgi:hypothetical protein|nr:hypothetical protein [Solirubrobacteraceae bacterium]
MTERRPSTESELVEFVRSIDAQAPQSLHRRVEALIDAKGRAGEERQGARRYLRPRVAAAGALAAAIAAVAVAVGLGGGSSARLTVSEAAALTLRPATHAAPRESASKHSQLMAAVDGVSFPYWNARFGWRASGERTDRIAGRAVTTVFYSDARGRRIGYAIVAGLPAPGASGGVVAWDRGTPYRMLRYNGIAVITWVRAGRLCVVSGRDLGTSTLLHLARWDGSHGASSSTAA